MIYNKAMGKKILSMDEVIEILRRELPFLTSKYGVKKMGIFGSYAKGLQSGKSDIDILVELKKPLGLEFIELADRLEEILGKKADVATFECFRRSLKNPRYRHIAENVKKTIIYVQ